MWYVIHLNICKDQVLKIQIWRSSGVGWDKFFLDAGDICLCGSALVAHGPLWIQVREKMQQEGNMTDNTKLLILYLGIFGIWTHNILETHQTSQASGDPHRVVGESSPWDQGWC